MKLNDAKPGDVLRDKDGDLWLRLADRAALLTQRGAKFHGHGESLDMPWSDAQQGPFTRLVPEHNACPICGPVVAGDFKGETHGDD